MCVCVCACVCARARACLCVSVSVSEITHELGHPEQIFMNSYFFHKLREPVHFF